MNPAENSVGRVETQYKRIELPPGGFALESGGFLPELTIAYETYGTLNSAGDNALLICHALSGDAHVAGYHNPEDPKTAGWWENMVGPGKGIDTTLYFVICANILGGCRGTTGPSSIDPRTARPYGASFPQVTVGDMVRAHALLLDALGVRTLASVIGGSFGGMQVLEWLLAHPSRVRSCMCIASAAAISAQALAFDVVGRRAILDDPDWSNGNFYDTDAKPRRGLALARRLAHITYLSPRLLDEKFGRAKWTTPHPKVQKDLSSPFISRFQVESYLEHQGEKFVARFDANSYLHITSALDEFDLEARYQSLANAFSHAQGKSLFVALSSDWLFPPNQSMDMVKAAIEARKPVSYCELNSPYGHDAFLVSIEHLSEVIRAFLPWVSTPAAVKADAETVARYASRCSTPSEESVNRAIIEAVPQGSAVLDLGCGDGRLLNRLREKRQIRGIGIDLDLSKVIAVIDAGHEALQVDIDQGLSMFPDNRFDVAIISETLQTLRKPQYVLREMARVANICIAGFPNFGNWFHRFRLWRTGRMPKGKSLPYEWYNTPNIHLFSLLDFGDLCRLEGLEITHVECIPFRPLDRLLVRMGFHNLGADHVVAVIRKPAPKP